MSEWFGTWRNIQKDRPKKDGEYIVWFRFTDLTERDYSHADVSDFTDGRFTESQAGAQITHWMPLPEPPK